MLIKKILWELDSSENEFYATCRYMIYTVQPKMRKKWRKNTKAAARSKNVVFFAVSLQELSTRKKLKVYVHDSYSLPKG